MGAIWSEQYKFQTWLDVEIAVCEAQAELGYIPQAAVDEIKAKGLYQISLSKLAKTWIANKSKIAS